LSKGQKPEKIPYTFNKLTTLLRDTVDGKSKTFILFMMAPSVYDVVASLDTLRFAAATGAIR